MTALAPILSKWPKEREIPRECKLPPPWSAYEIGAFPWCHVCTERMSGGTVKIVTDRVRGSWQEDKDAAGGWWAVYEVWCYKHSDPAAPGSGATGYMKVKVSLTMIREGGAIELGTAFEPPKEEPSVLPGPEGRLALAAGEGDRVPEGGAAVQTPMAEGAGHLEGTDAGTDHSPSADAGHVEEKMPALREGAAGEGTEADQADGAKAVAHADRADESTTSAAGERVGGAAGTDPGAGRQPVLLVRASTRRPRGDGGTRVAAGTRARRQRDEPKLGGKLGVPPRKRADDDSRRSQGASGAAFDLPRGRSLTGADGRRDRAKPTRVGAEGRAAGHRSRKKGQLSRRRKRSK